MTAGSGRFAFMTQSADWIVLVFIVSSKQTNARWKAGPLCLDVGFRSLATSVGWITKLEHVLLLTRPHRQSPVAVSVYDLEMLRQRMQRGEVRFPNVPCEMRDANISEGYSSCDRRQIWCRLANSGLKGRWRKEAILDYPQRKKRDRRQGRRL